MCSVASVVGEKVIHWRGNDICVACTTSLAIWCHDLQSFSLNAVSHSKCSCHSCCKNNLAEMVTGDIRPSGSKILELHLKISRLVTVVVRVAISCLGDG